MDSPKSTLLAKLYLYSLILAAVVFPLSHKLYFFSLVLASVLWLLLGQRNLKSFKSAKINHHFVIIASVYLFLIIAMGYSQNAAQGLRDLETMSSFLIVPFLIFYGPIDRKGADLIIAFFCASICLICMACLVFVIHKAVVHNQPLFFIITNYWYQTTYFTEFFKIHPTYLSIFASFATIYYLNQVFHKGPVQNKVFSILALILLSIANFLLVSRGGLIALGVCLLFFAFTTVKSRNKYWLIGLLIVSCYVAFKYVHGFKRFIEPIFALKESWSEDDPVTSTSMHFKSWQCAAESLLSNHFFFGHGTGDEMDKLYACYYRKGFREMITLKLNSHNQYLSTMMQGGIVGLTLLMLTYLYSVRRAIEASDILFGCFLLLILITSLFESILNVYRGVAFFSMFNAAMIKRAILKL
jgi:O-antigen ligase